ncbi:Gfo/Idh/MocA family oxidoreductase [Brevibacillus borstelensis]|uniref:Gfo/Idh/MocA family oxidoreductase n=1 Tax=Brevibacillus borstelensis TaxID=45462 RepID=UPI0030C62A85
MNLKIGVIGVGAMGKNHVRVLDGLSDRCQLTGVYDLEPERGASIARDFDTRSFAELDSLLESVDAAVVAVPVFGHYDVAKKCMERGIHVFVEKPLTATIEQGRELIGLARTKKVKLQVGHIEMFNPTIRVLKDIMQHEEVIAIDIHRLSPFDERVKDIDVVMDTMIHDLYILSYLAGDQPAKCTAYGRALHQHLNHVVATFQYENAVIATLTASIVTEEKVRTIDVVTRNAYIRADLMDRKIVISRSTNFFMSNRNADYKQQNIMEKVIVPFQEPLREQLVHFLDCIRFDHEPMVTAEDGLNTLLMADKVKRSMIRLKEAGEPS